MYSAVLLCILVPHEDGDQHCNRRIYFGTIELLDDNTLQEVGITEGSQLTLVVTPAFRIVTADEDGTAKIWSSASGACLRTLCGHVFCVVSAVFSPDGNAVLTGSRDRTAALWSVASGMCMRIFKDEKLVLCVPGQ